MSTEYSISPLGYQFKQIQTANKTCLSLSVTSLPLPNLQMQTVCMTEPYQIMNSLTPYDFICKLTVS